MRQVTKVELWRKEKEYSYQYLADLLGCSRQYVERICKDGTASVVRAIKLMEIANGELTLQDMITPEAKEELIRQGYIVASDNRGLVEEDYLV